jgi:hypothetical protein
MVDFSISNFKASINNNGILRNNMFLVNIARPTVLRNSGFVLTREVEIKSKTFDMLDIVTLRCESVNLPGMNLLTTDGIYRYGYGPPEKIPYGAIFTDLSASFIVDRSGSQFRFFNVWMNNIYNVDSSKGIGAVNPDTGSQTFEMGYKGTYATDITIFVYNEQTDKVLEMTLHEAYPYQVNDVPLSWSGRDDMILLNVAFTYRNFVMKNVEGLSKINILSLFGIK